MKFQILAFLLLACARSLGIRYEDVICGQISQKGSRVDREMPEVSPAMFTIKDGVAMSCKYLNRRTILNPLDMFEEDFDKISFEGMLVPVENSGKDEVDTKYLVEGYETALDAIGINHLCLSTVFDTSFLKRKGIKDAVISYRSYLEESKAKMLGESLSSAFDGAKVYVAPEALCGLAYKVNHIVDDSVFHCLAIVMSGRKTVFSFYKVDIGGKKRRFENLFHIESDIISDGRLQKIIYRHISAKLNEYISVRDDIPEDYKKVTLYPRQPDSKLFDLKVDMRPMYKEVAKALGSRDVVDSVKIIKGLNVVNEDEQTKFVVEAPIFRTADIQKELSEMMKDVEAKINGVIDNVRNSIIEKIGESGMYSVLVRSEFSDNPIFAEILGRFGSNDDIKPEYIEHGASILRRREYEIMDPKVFEVTSSSTSGSLFLEEVELRKEIGRILDEKKSALRKIFKDVPDSSLEGAEELFVNIQNLDGIRKAVLKWRSLRLEDINARREQEQREKALINLRETVASVEKQGKKNEEVWNGGLHEQVTKAKEQLKVMSKDSKYKGHQIEDVELDLIVKNKSLFADYEKKIKMEKEEEARKKEEEEKKEGSNAEGNDEKDNQEPNAEGNDEKDNEEPNAEGNDEKDNGEPVPLDDISEIKMEL